MTQATQQPRKRNKARRKRTNSVLTGGAIPPLTATTATLPPSIRCQPTIAILEIFPKIPKHYSSENQSFRAGLNPARKKSSWLFLLDSCVCESPPSCARLQAGVGFVSLTGRAEELRERRRQSSEEIGRDMSASGGDVSVLFACNIYLCRQPK